MIGGWESEPGALSSGAGALLPLEAGVGRWDGVFWGEAAAEQPTDDRSPGRRLWDLGALRRDWGPGLEHQHLGVQTSLQHKKPGCCNSQELCLRRNCTRGVKDGLDFKLEETGRPGGDGSVVQQLRWVRLSSQQGGLNTPL